MREMKDSGIEWIGEIPKEWSVVKVKHLCKVTDGTHFSPQTTEVGKPYITVSNVNNSKIDIQGALTISEEDFETLVKQGCQPKIGDVLLSKDGTVGRTAVVMDDNAFVCLSSLGILSPCNYLYSSFLKYMLDSILLQDQMIQAMAGSALRRITISKINDFLILLPAKTEQRVIADFLDTQCSEIDATAEDIQKEISLLEDYKKSLVYNVISNGINHSIYSTENDEVWGNLPQGWKLVDIKYLFEIVKRIAGKEGYDVLSVTQKGLKIKDITSGDGQLADNYSGYQFVYPTDYVMNHMDLLTGWVDCSELFGVTSPDYRVFRLMDKAANNLVYYKYVMQCCYMNKIFYSLGQGVSNLGRWRLQTSSFNNFKVPVPPKDEQDEIADYLDSKCSEIDSLIADKKRQLDVLADYKKSLIYEYVTGKKEVPVKDF